MPQSQESKTKPIIDAVSPTLPQVVAPPPINPPSMPAQMPSEQAESDASLSSLEQELMVGATPDQNLEQELMVGATPEIDPALESELMVGSPNEHLNKNESKWGKLASFYETITIPNKLLRKKAAEGIDELFGMSGYKDGEYNSVWKNVAHNMPKAVVEAFAEIGVDMISDPITIGTMGWGKGVSAIAKTKVAQEAFVPILKASADYFAGRTPEFLRVSAKTVADLAKDVLTKERTLLGSEMLGKAFDKATPFIGKAAEKVQDAVEWGVGTVLGGKLGTDLRRGMTYKYGLPHVENYIHKMRSLFKAHNEATINSAVTGETLWKGMSPEALQFSDSLMKGGFDEADFEHIMLLASKDMQAMGIKDPSKYMNDIVNARQYIDDLSEKLATEGLESGFLTVESAAIIRGNKGKYVGRFFDMFENPEIRENIRTGATTVEESLGIAKNLKENLIAAGFTEDAAKAFNSLSTSSKAHWLNKLGLESIPTKGSQSSITASTMLLRKRKDLDDLTRHALGEMNVAYSVARTGEEIGTVLANLKIFKQLSTEKEFSVKLVGSQVAPRGWGKLVGPKYGHLNGYHVHPAILEDINGTIYAGTKENPMLFWWNKLQRDFKVNKVAGNPKTRIGNVIGQAFMNDFSGVSIFDMPKLYTTAIKSVTRKDALYKRAINNDVFVQQHASTELLQKMRGPIDKMAVSEGARLKGNFIKNAYKGWQQRNVDEFAKEESVGRFVKFIDSINKGMSDKEAGLEAIKWGIDYMKISPFAKYIRDNPFYPIPFATIAIKAPQLILESAMKNPFRLYKWFNFISNYNAASMRQIGASDKDVEYIRSKRGIVLVHPARSQSGKPLITSLNNFIPAADVVNIMRGDLLKKGSPPSVMRSGGPAVMFLEARAGVKQTGGRIYQEDDNARLKTKKIINHIYQGYFPGIAPNPDFILSPLTLGIDWSLNRVGVDANLFKNLTFAGDNIQGGGIVTNQVVTAFTHDLVEVYGDYDVDTVTIGGALMKGLAARRNEEFSKETTLIPAVIDALLGIGIKPIDEKLLKSIDAGQLTKNLNAAKMMFVREIVDQNVPKALHEVYKDNFKEKQQEIIHDWTEVHNRFHANPDSTQPPSQHPSDFQLQEMGIPLPPTE